MMKNLKTALLYLFIFILLGCGSSHPKIYRIGLDPSWFPLDTANKEANLFAFMTELMKEVTLRKKIQLERVSMNWDNLVDGLKQDRYDAILTSMKPTLMNEKEYDFSPLIMKTGPVLIVPINSPIDSLQDMKNQVLLISKGSWLLDYMGKYPEVELQFYSYVNEALEDLLKEKAFGTLVPLIPATSCINDLYSTELKIVGSPLLDEGIRLVSPHQKNGHLMKIFEEALEEMKDDGTFEKLLEKWSLPKEAL